MTSLSSSRLPSGIFKLLADDPSTPSPMHPGEILREDLMPHYALSACDVARRLDVPVSTVESLLAERTRVSADLALRLGAAFAQSPGYWRALQLQYDLWTDAVTRTDGPADTAQSKRDRRPAA